VRTVLLTISIATILIYLSTLGVEIGSKPYWIVTLLITIHGVICSWGRE
jgi:hypothetical protein